jgi:hypothetical protein
MTDPKNELGARFDQRRPDGEEDSEGDEKESVESGKDNSNNTGNTNNSSVADSSSDSGSKPGPDPDENATRHRRQVPMYLPEEKADSLNGLYERLDGRSKVDGNGGIEKHADFMEEVVELAVDNEDELADRLGL